MTNPTGDALRAAGWKGQAAVGIRYLIRNRGQAAKAHLWVNGDTICRMFSTGGLKPARYMVCDDRGDREVCHMCEIGLK